MNGATFKQISAAYLIGVACLSAFLLPGAVSNYAGRVGVAVPLIGIAFCAAFGQLLFRLVQQDGSVSAYVRRRFGQAADSAVRVLLLLWLVGIAVFYLAAFYDRLASTSFVYAPRWLCLCALVLCAALFLQLQPQHIGRSAQIVFLIMLVCLAVLPLFCFGSMHWQELVPAKQNYFTDVLRAFLFPVGTMGLMAVLLYDESGGIQSAAPLRRCLIAGNLVMCGILVLTQSVFGLPLSQKLAYPFFSLIRSSDSLLGSEHLESLISGIWIIISLCFFTVLLYLAVGHMRALFARTLRREFIGFVPAAVVLAAAFVLPENRFLNETVLGNWVPAGNFIIGVFGVGILTLTIRKL